MQFNNKQMNKIEELGWSVKVEVYQCEYFCEKYIELTKTTKGGLKFTFSLDYYDADSELNEAVEFFDEAEIMDKLKANNETSLEGYELWVEVKEIEEDLQELERELRGL